jgi:hypothetical protein
MRLFGGDFNETFRRLRTTSANGKQSIGFYLQCEDFKDVEKMVGAEAAVLFVDEATADQVGPLLRCCCRHCGCRKTRRESAPYRDDDVRREPDRGID